MGQARGDAFDNLAGPRDPPPRPAPTREGWCANAFDSTKKQRAPTSECGSLWSAPNSNRRLVDAPPQFHQSQADRLEHAVQIAVHILVGEAKDIEPLRGKR